MKLVLVESPTKARTISRFLPKDYRIEATFGHIRDLPQKRFGVEVKKGFKPEYVLVKGRSKRVKELQKLAKESEEIILATDLDREGEAIAWHAAVLLGKWEVGSGITPLTSHLRGPMNIGPNHTSHITHRTSQLKRIVFHEITKSAIEKALKNPRGIDMNLVNAQQARRILDRLVGYKLSPLLWKKVRKGLSAGRVQSVAVKLIVDREREREAFVPEEYWNVEVELQQFEVQGSRFKVKLEKIDGERAKIENEKEAAKAVADLKRADYTVSGVEKKEVKRQPAPPFTTSTLQQTAARFMRWSGKKTMMHAQNLYEKGLITYHRTDSVSLAKPALGMVRRYIEAEFGKEYLPEKARIYKTKSKLAQEAHEAVRPTAVDVASTSVGAKATGERGPAFAKATAGELGRDDGRLYELIWRRFVACQMAAAVFDQTKIEVSGEVNNKGNQGNKGDKGKEYLLRAKGEVEKFAGFLRVYRGDEGDQDNQGKDLPSGRHGKSKKEERQILPEVKEGEVLEFVDIAAEQKFTQPPARYSEAMLVKKLETEGIGRPSTYAPIISTIQERNYVEKDEGHFAPTPLGGVVNDFLVGNFSDIVNVKFTAEMEDEFDGIAQEGKEWKVVLGEFYSPFEKKLVEVEQKAERVKVPVEKLGEKCPECGEGELVVRVGKFGKFIACSRFPKCKYSKTYVEKAGLDCPKCGGEVIVKRTRRGKRFYGCLNYPECDFAAWKKKDITEKA